MDAPLLSCSYCQATLPPAAVDREREIASCPACGRLNDVRSQLRAPAPVAHTAHAAHTVHAAYAVHAAQAPPQPRARPPVQLPPGMSMSFEGGGFFGLEAPGSPVTIRRRWLRGKHWILLLICAGFSAGLASLWQSQGVTGWTVVGTLFVLSWDYNVMTAFVNSTVIRADAAGVGVKHGPLPSLFGLGRRVAREQVKQLFAAKFGSLFAVKAQLVDGNEIDLVRPLVSAEQALFVEQQLEKSLGITDFAVDGELGSASPPSIDGKPVAGAGSGTALGCLIPVLIGGAIALFFFMASSEVSGTLTATPPLGAWTFKPDDCASGQLEGFAGVTLKSSDDRGPEVRLIQDPVKGTLVVATAHGIRKVFDAEQCPVFLIHVERSNTQINDVWSMQGTSTLECPGLRGAVEFSGCH